MPRKKKLPRNVVKKKNSDAWYVRRTFINNGERTEIWRRCYDETPEGAEALLKSIVEEYNRAALNAEKPPQNFRELADKFLEREITEAVYDKSGKKIAGRRSLKTPKKMVEFWQEHFNRRAFDAISYGELKELKQKLLKTPVVSPKQKIETQRSLRTVNYYLQILRQIFNFAINNRWLLRSPFADGKSLINSSEETRRYVNWSREEESAALALCTEEHGRAHLKPIIICITDGGFRRGELFNAKWTDVDFKTEIVLAKSYKGKNLTVRPIYMTKRMKASLLEWQAIQKKEKIFAPDGLVIGMNSVKRSWQTVTDKINRKDLQLRDLRHVFATRMHTEVKAQMKDIGEMLGHKNTKTTEIYINPVREILRDHVKGLDDFHEKPKRVIKKVQKVKPENSDKSV